MARQPLYPLRLSHTKNPPSWHKTAIAQGISHLDGGCPDGTIMDATPAPGRTYTRWTWPPRGRGRGESLYSDRRMKAKLRAIEVVELRLFGQLTWEEIARRLGFRDKSGAFRAYHRTMGRIEWDKRRKVELKREELCYQLGITQTQLMELWRRLQSDQP